MYSLLKFPQWKQVVLISSLVFSVRTASYGLSFSVLLWPKREVRGPWKLGKENRESMICRTVRTFQHLPEPELKRKVCTFRSEQKERSQNLSVFQVRVIIIARQSQHYKTMKIGPFIRKKKDVAYLVRGLHKIHLNWPHLYDYGLHETRTAPINGLCLRSCLNDGLLEEKQCI